MKIRPSRILYAILSLAFILMMGMGHLSAQVPSLLEYDGYMTGNITGNRTIGVKLYNASTNGTLPLFFATGSHDQSTNANQ